MPPRPFTSKRTGPTQSPEEIRELIAAFLREHAGAVALDDGKVLFDLRESEHSISTNHGHCTLHLWNSDGNTVRRILSATMRADTLLLDTMRFGQSQTKLLELTPSRHTRTPSTRDTSRQRYMRLLERVLAKTHPDWKPKGFRTAMDLERSFGPAYTRGSLVKGTQAWAVIGINQHESQVTVDGILTLGILWLHHCRQNAGGKRLFQGLKVIVPQGMAMLTQSRMAWLSSVAAKWELFEFAENTEDLTMLDADDVGNLRTRLVHRPDENAARLRFAHAADRVLALVPEGEEGRVEQRLRSSTEIAFLLHGLEFARARVTLANSSFSSGLRITVGTGESETELTEDTQEELKTLLGDLFRRRRAVVRPPDYTKRGNSPDRRIGVSTKLAAHTRFRATAEEDHGRNAFAQHDPLFRAAPERWLESVLRQDLSPLTRGLAAEYQPSARSSVTDDAEVDGNRSDETQPQGAVTSRAIPKLNPEHVYTQVPAIAGASDRGMLDLLGVTTDARLAVIELKADDDLHLALQGLDYWIRVRHHHLQARDESGVGEFQRHGYFRGVELSQLPPRLYLVAPALHIHPATETILRYLSPRVEWTLLALDERWRQHIRVVWRKCNS